MKPFWYGIIIIPPWTVIVIPLLFRNGDYCQCLSYIYRAPSQCISTASVSALSTVSKCITTLCVRMSAVKVESAEMEYAAGVKQELPAVEEFTAGPWVVQDIKQEPLCVSIPHTAVSQYIWVGLQICSIAAKIHCTTVWI